jgi:hypothetical protein
MEETNKPDELEERLRKFIQKKNNENEVLKKILDRLESESHGNETPKKNSKNKKNNS